MTLEECKNLKERDLVVCTKTLTGIFTRHRLYEIGGGYFEAPNFNDTVNVKYSDLGIYDGWSHENFIKSCHTLEILLK